MKKVLLLVTATLLIVGCGEKTIHTYYGDFVTDTMNVGMRYKDGSPCYVVHTEDRDTFYYNPENDIYIHQFPTNDQWGNAVVIYNPYTNEYE